MKILCQYFAAFAGAPFSSALSSHPHIAKMDNPARTPGFPAPPQPARRKLDLARIYAEFEERAAHPERFRRGNPEPIFAAMRRRRTNEPATVEDEKKPTVEVHSPSLPLASSFLNRYCRAETARLLSDTIQLLWELTYRDTLCEKTGKDPAGESGYREAWLETAKMVEGLIVAEEPDRWRMEKLAPLPLPTVGTVPLHPALVTALDQYLDPDGCARLIESLVSASGPAGGISLPGGGGRPEDIFYRHARSGQFPAVGAAPDSSVQFRCPAELNARQKISGGGRVVVDRGGIMRDPEAVQLCDEEVECRFYFSIKPYYASIFWEKLTRVLDEAHKDRRPFQAKAFLESKRYEQSADPVVLVFRSMDQEYFYSAIVNLTDFLLKDWFHDSMRPPFAAQALKESGASIRGVFAAESPFQARMSFNGRIAKAIMWAVRAEALLVLMGREVSLEDRRQIMARHLEWFGVDLSNPAFNAGRGDIRPGIERFGYIWRHTDQGRMPSPPTAGLQVPVIYVRAEDGDPMSSFVEGKGEGFVVGRGEGLRFSLPELSALSRRHCEFFVKDGRWHVRDLESRNGTRVNGRRVFECIVSDGDIIEAGGKSWRAWLKSPDGETDYVLLIKNVKFLAESTRLNIEPPDDVERKEALRVRAGTLSLDTAGKVVGCHTRWPFDIGRGMPTQTGIFSRAAFFDAILFDGRLVWRGAISNLNPYQQSAVMAISEESAGAREKMEGEFPGLLADVLEWLRG